MSLLDLTPELVHLICEQCGTDELLDLRLTCRWLCDIANRHFLPELRACVEWHDFAALREIAESKTVIRHSVKSLTVQMDDCGPGPGYDQPSFHRYLMLRKDFLAEHGMDLLQWRDELRQRRATKSQATRIRAMDQFLRRSFRQLGSRRSELAEKLYYRFLRVAEIQQEVLGKLFLSGSHTSCREATLARTAKTVFAACPNISSVTLNWGNTFRQNLGFSNLKFLRNSVIPHQGVVDPEGNTEHAIFELIPVIRGANIRIEELAIAGASPRFTHPKLWESEDLGPLLRDVQRLRLVFNGAEAHPADYAFDDCDEVLDADAIEDGGIPHWLRHCPQLRELQLTMLSATEDEEMVRLECMLGDLHLRYLTTLHLAKFKTLPDQLIQCLLRHKATLQDLTLEEIHLSEGAWGECLRGFAGQLPQLRVVKVCGALTSTDRHHGRTTQYINHTMQSRGQQRREASAVEQYILTGNGDAPYFEDEEIEDSSGTDGSEFSSDLDTEPGDERLRYPPVDDFEDEIQAIGAEMLAQAQADGDSSPGFFDYGDGGWYDDYM